MTSKIEQAGEKFLGKRCPSAAEAAVDFAEPKARLEAAPFQDVSDPVSFFPPFLLIRPSWLRVHRTRFSAAVMSVQIP